MRELTVNAITEVLASVETSLPVEVVGEVVNSVMTQQPAALRLLAVLDKDPGVLTSAESTMPKALERIITVLHERGAHHLRRPQCSRCGEARSPLVGRDGTARVCNACDSRARRVHRRCDNCGEHRLWAATVAGVSYCQRCWRRELPGAPLRITRVVHKRLPDLDRSLIERTVETSVGAAAGKMTLALELEAAGAEWFADPALGTVLFTTLYDALRNAGAPLPARRCGHCNTDTTTGIRLVGVLDGRRCCRKCYRRGHLAACDGCGELASLERRQPDGSRYCQRCTNGLPDESAECISCGHHRLIGQRTPAGPICTSCRGRQLIDTCTRCGRSTPCRFAGTDRAICEPCATPKLRCIRCDRQRVVHSRTHDGQPICHGCAEPVIDTCTDCGRQRPVKGRAAGAPYCGTCYPKNPVSFRDCARCGRHAYLTIRTLCKRCEAHDKITTLIPDNLIEAHPQLQALRDSCLAAEPAVILHAFRRKGSTEIFRTLLARPDDISHTALDALGGHSATRTVRSLLVEHATLPHRDEHLAHLEAWIDTTAGNIPNPTERRAFTQFARWRHLRYLRRRPTPASYGQATSRRRELTLVHDLLTWAQQHKRSLATLTQHDLDRWRAAGPADRHRVKHFLDWAHRNHYTQQIQITTAPDGYTLAAGDGISEDDRWRLLQTVFTAENTAAPATRLAAALVLLYGVRVHRIATLKLSDVTRRDNLIHVRLGTEPLLLPDELGPLAESTTRDRAAERLFGPAEDTEWLFPGTAAGYPISVDALTGRLTALGVQPRSARKTALASLAMQRPPAIISRLTGLNAVTAARWAQAVAASNAKYAATSMHRRMMSE